MPGADVHDLSYYGKCMIGGILSCGITHTVVCPLDIIKCRKQVRLPFSQDPSEGAAIHVISRRSPRAEC